MKAKNRFERGQALVLIVLAIVAMFGFAALAVDMGRVYAERRRVQNAADSAALAAAYAASQSTSVANQTADAQAAAFKQLSLNGITDNDPDANPGLIPDVEIHHPPVSGPYAGNNEYYQVVIHSAVDQVFSQFVYRGPLAMSVEAVGHFKAADGTADGMALHATSKGQCKALEFNGNGKTTINGGGAFSDSNAGTCSPTTGSCYSAVMDGNGDVIIPDGSLGTVGGWNKNGGSGNPPTSINTCTTPPVLPSINPPDCTGKPSLTYGGGSATLEPGIYPNIIMTGNPKTTVLHLNPGMYCLDGDIQMNGGMLTGDGVLLYMRSGSIQLTGGASINLTAPKDMPNNDMNWANMLIYMPPENDGEIHIGGGAGSTYTGTIYAPGPRKQTNQSKCIIEGNSGTIAMRSNLICDTIKIAGNANINLTYDGKLAFKMPSVIDLSQ